MGDCARLIKAIGNLCYCGVFFTSAYLHVMKWDDAVDKINQTFIPPSISSYCLMLAVGCLILGSISIILDVKPVFGHICFILFLVPVTIVMHALPCIVAKTQVGFFVKCVCIIHQMT